MESKSNTWVWLLAFTGMGVAAYFVLKAMKQGPGLPAGAVPMPAQSAEPIPPSTNPNPNLVAMPNIKNVLACKRAKGLWDGQKAVCYQQLGTAVLK